MNTETIKTVSCPATTPAQPSSRPTSNTAMAWLWDRFQAYQRARSERLMWAVARADPRVARELQALRDRQSWDQHH